MNNMIYDKNYGQEWRTVTLITVGAVISGVAIVFATACLLRIIGDTTDGWKMLAAYLIGSIGFMLTAPLNIYLQISKKFRFSTIKTISIWLLTVVAVNLLGIAIGSILVYSSPNISDNNATTIQTSTFLSGVFLTYTSGGIHWIAYRKNTHPHS